MAKQLPFAMARALTATAWDIQRHITEELPNYLDRPTPFTRKAFGVQRANKRELRARVFVKDRQSRYLKYQVEGGTRTPKGRAIVVPYTRGGAIKLNKYGNLPRGRVAKLIAQNKTFSGTVKGTPGVWRRTGTKSRPTKGRRYTPRAAPQGTAGQGRYLQLLIGYESFASYQPRLPMLALAREEYRRVWSRNVAQSLALAVKTAR